MSQQLQATPLVISINGKVSNLFDGGHNVPITHFDTRLAMMSIISTCDMSQHYRSTPLIDGNNQKACSN